MKEYHRITVTLCLEHGSPGSNDGMPLDGRWCPLLTTWWHSIIQQKLRHCNSRKHWFPRSTLTTITVDLSTM